MNELVEAVALRFGQAIDIGTDPEGDAGELLDSAESGYIVRGIGGLEDLSDNDGPRCVRLEVLQIFGSGLVAARHGDGHELGDALTEGHVLKRCFHRIGIGVGRGGRIRGRRVRCRCGAVDDAGGGDVGVLCGDEAQKSGQEQLRHGVVPWECMGDSIRMRGVGRSCPWFGLVRRGLPRPSPLRGTMQASCPTPQRRYARAPQQAGLSPKGTDDAPAAVFADLANVA